MHKLEGDGNGDDDEWHADLVIEIRTEDDEGAPGATVVVQWEGAGSGTRSFVTNSGGQVDTQIGEFDEGTVTFTVVRVRLEGYTYRPDLNGVPNSIVIGSPD